MGAHMVACCDICGDEGVLEAIATCSRCNVSREHVYCMRVVLKEVPSDWCCENCEHNSNIVMPTSTVMEDFSELFYSSPSSKHQRVQAQPNKDLSSKQKTTTEREKKIQLGKVKPLSSEEVIMLSSGSTVAPVKNSARPSTVSKKSKTSSPEKSPLETSGSTPNVSSITIRANHPRHGTSSQISSQINALSRQQFLKEARVIRDTETSGSESVSRKVAMQSAAKEHKLDHFKQKSAMVAPKDNIASAKMAASMVEKDTIRTPLRESLTVEKDTIRTSPRESLTKGGQQPLKSGGVGSPYTVPQPEHTIAKLKSVIYISAGDQCLSGPIPQYFWKGSLRVKNNSKFEEIQIQAHHPSRVHKKAYEFSKKMPDVLNFELIDQKGISVKLFADHLPDQNDIALYFKPSNEKRYGNYVFFMEHIQANNLALRMEIDGIELLVFVSNALRPDCQKYERSYFLWGLFYRKKVVKAASGPSDLYADQNHEENDDIDMEIDMVGGLDVGIKDIVTNTHKPPRDKKIGGDAPPGFDSTHRLRVQSPRDKNIGGGAPPGFDSTLKLRVQSPRDKNIGGGSAPPGFDSTRRLRVQTSRDKNVGGDAPPGLDSTHRLRVQTPISGNAPPRFDSTLRFHTTPKNKNIGGGSGGGGDDGGDGGSVGAG